MLRIPSGGLFCDLCLLAELPLWSSSLWGHGSWSQGWWAKGCGPGLKTAIQLAQLIHNISPFLRIWGPGQGPQGPGQGPVGVMKGREGQREGGKERERERDTCLPQQMLMSLCTALSPYFPPMAPKGPCPGALGPLPRTPRALGQEKISEFEKIEKFEKIENSRMCVFVKLYINTSSKNSRNSRNSRIRECSRIIFLHFHFRGPRPGPLRCHGPLFRTFVNSKLRGLVSSCCHKHALCR